MGVINVLDKHVAELIAAGEVVERPASVIKELVENAIDAGAKHITVEIKNGGTTFMRVTDDGCGFLRDDIKLAFLRHATSKVKVQDDLDRIATLGFRGEALASISAVSRLQLITRNAGDEMGTSYVIEGGEEKSFDDAGCPVGTTFVIRDLFYNIPARAKFLKKDVSEGNSVSNIVDKTALSHPEIAFTFVRDGKQALKTSGDGKLSSAIYAVFGREFASGLIPVDYQLDGITVTGYVSKPVHARPNHNMQNFFINGRYVKSRTAMAALDEAFKGSVMVGKFPSCVLNLTLPFEAIDVNVHPAKIEVRFINERPVFDAVYHAAKSALLKHDDRKQAHFKDNSAVHEIERSSTFNTAQAVFRKPAPPKPRPQPPIKPKDEFNPFDEVEFVNPAPKVQSIDSLSVKENTNPFDVYSKQAVKNTKREESYKPAQTLPLIQKTDSPKPAAVNPPEEIVVTEKDNSEPVVLYEQQKDELKYVGELFDTYIIVEKNQKEMLLIDKHAAHERIIYEKLKAEKAGSSAQLLLTPITVTLGKNEYDAAIRHLDMFSDCSFEVEDFGNSTVLVRSAPQYIDASEVADCVTEMADYISMGKNDIFTGKMDWFYHNVACRSAIKAGHKNSAQELIDIVKTLEENPQIRYCPHGRPVCIVMKKSEIERQFGRA
ncbi:DNA mismatch repair endonuclease MutL [Lachnoclostridium sp. MSJ-17]|uniref:DNA mismatch repair endonuclease MutL n=1 Tax=Lachnoclostridium sp. MSJ-17 TaxID=2841516 RepID=UPI001C111E55|nr:DNA mismatch repair endonuclease MutL [Lachnoclostridium sp. MSJ-17]MBU5462526.1 DNA mismatch repair endonuclease MutL [Lachnoclostridium sp. MSJ-17]